MFNNLFFQKSCRLWGNVEKFSGVREGTNDSMAYESFMMDKQGYMHKPTRPSTRLNAPKPAGMCNNYCFSTATMVTWTRLSGTLYEHCVSCKISLQFFYTSYPSSCRKAILRMHLRIYRESEWHFSVVSCKNIHPFVPLSFHILLLLFLGSFRELFKANQRMISHVSSRKQSVAMETESKFCAWVFFLSPDLLPFTLYHRF